VESASSAAATFRVLVQVMDSCLRLLHPYIPFVTEETWQQMRKALESSDYGRLLVTSWPEALIIAEWPTPGDTYPEEANDFERVVELVRAIRSVRSEYNVEPGKRIAAMIVGGSKASMLRSQRAILGFLARLDDSQTVISEEMTAPDSAVTISQGDITAYLPLAGLVDIAKEQARLNGELAKLEEQFQRINKLLEGDFAKKAPPQVVEKEREKLAHIQASRAELTERLNTLE